MSEFGKNKPRDYIKASEDLKTGDKVLFVTGGEWVTKDFSELQDGSKEKTVYVAKVSVNGADTKELTINSTSGKSLAKEWNEEGDGWRGKIAKVGFVRMVCFGETKDVLELIPTDEAKQIEEQFTE